MRTWTHSEDTADAIICLYEKAERNKIYNISSEYEQTNLNTVLKIINSFYFGKLTVDMPDFHNHLDLSFERPGQDVRYAISCNPLRKLGWKPKKIFDMELVILVEQFKQEFIW